MRGTLLLLFWFVLGVTMAKWLGPRVTSFIDLPSFMFLAIGASAILAINFTIREILVYPFHTFVSYNRLNGRDRWRILIYWRSATQALLAAGSLGTLTGFIGIAANITDRNAIRPATTVAMLTLLYAFVPLVMFSIPGEICVRRDIRKARNEQ